MFEGCRSCGVAVAAYVCGLWPGFVRVCHTYRAARLWLILLLHAAASVFLLLFTEKRGCWKLLF